MNKSERKELIGKIMKYSSYKEEYLKDKTINELFAIFDDSMADENVMAGITGKAAVDSQDVADISEIDRGVVDYIKKFDESAFEEHNGKKYIKLSNLYDIAYRVMGIQSYIPTVIQSPNSENGMVAVVRSELRFDDGRVFCALADASINNTSTEFSVYPTAIAESRALARALIKAMNIKFNAVEEIPFDKMNVDENDMTNTQIELVKKLLKDKDKQWSEVKDKIGYEHITKMEDFLSLKHIDAIKIIKYLQTKIRDKS